ncbi:MAG TPA: histidine triad nucleotide-binding protein [bacterium]
MSKCLFCDIVEGKIKADIIHRDDDLVAFRDINPQAPVHFLVVPKKHLATTNDLDTESAKVIGKMFIAAKTLASKAGISEKGYRLVMNCNAEAGQSVFHIHLHVLGGRRMNWPPG